MAPVGQQGLHLPFQQSKKKMIKFVVLILATKICVASITILPNVNYNVPIAVTNPRINISYINMKGIKDHTLQVAPALSLDVASSSECLRACLKHRGVGVNLIEFDPTDHFHCQILNTDYYNNKALLVSMPGTTHYVIVVSEITKGEGRSTNVYSRCLTMETLKSQLP